jgi:hypothetical protein
MKASALVLILILAVSTAMAAGKNYKFDLDLEGIVGGKNLRAATYRVEVKCNDDAKGTVSFYDGYRLVAQVPCNMVTHTEGSDGYAVAYSTTADGKKVVSTIFLKGAKEKIVLSGAN